MSRAVIWDAVRAASINGFWLAAKNLELAREYWAASIRHYDELAGRGLAGGNPLAHVYENGWAQRDPALLVVLPAMLQTAGGTRLDELFILATTTAVLKPRRVFEIGTFEGRTTSVFVLNAPPTSAIYTLDLPAESNAESRAAQNIDTDVILIKERKVGHVLGHLGLAGRYEQLLGDSMSFDPTPYLGSIELGFIDGAHARRYVENDTMKMAAMMSERGLVFWHDYGGKGRFRELTAYLEFLGKRIRLFRIPNTTLAWSPALELKRLLNAQATEPT